MDAQGRRLLDALQAHGMAFGELGRRFGTAMNLHTTDATALVEILSAEDRGTPLTQAVLGQRVGLTPGATSSMLNRLEAAGHVIRVRGETDRRVVTLRASEGVEQLLDEFFVPLVERLDTMMRRHSPEALAHAERFLTDYVAAMNDFIDRQGRPRDDP